MSSSSAAPVSVQELLGSQLLVKDSDDGTTTTTSTSCLQGKHIGLLFSRTFTPSCHRFLPKLKQAYESLKSRGREFEVVYVSQESTQELFDEHYGAEMPWAALPFKSPNIAQLLDKFCTPSDTLPVLVMLDPEGHVLSRNAKLAVVTTPKGFPWVQQAPPSVTESFVKKMQPYAVPLFMLLALGYRMYYQEQGYWLYTQLVQAPLEALLQLLQPGIEALQTYMEALQAHLHKLYYQR